MAKITREKFKVFENVFDQHSYRNIYKLISEGYFDGVGSPVSIGKEANIFVGEFNDRRKPNIIKIYRLQTCNFNKMFEYIRADARFANLKTQKRQIVFAWTQREYRNILKAREAGIKVPTPLVVKDNIIVMEFIGDEDPAPRLNVCSPDKKYLKSFFEKTIDFMQKLNKAGLVHADLSEFNILNYNNSPVFIDFSQATISSHPHFKDFLKRDVYNVCRYFKKQGLKIDDEKVMKKIIQK